LTVPLLNYFYKNHLIEKPHRLWFYICGFNITIIAGLFTFLFSRLLGERKGAVVAGIGIISNNLLRADQNGWIKLTTDGRQMWVEVEKLA
jgi:hypothetical protein